MGRTNLARYKAIVKLRDEKGKTFEEIAQVVGVSRQRAWEIYQRAIKRFPKSAARGTAATPVIRYA